MLFDCMRCGACCRNPLENQVEGSREWVEVDASEPLAGRKEHAKLLERNEEGVLHLRLVEDERCIALRGAIGRQVRCSIYAVRPRGCRRVQPGDRGCLQYRADAGL
jgi:Fe-S-cluster containining protein